MNTNKRIFEITILALLASCNAAIELTLGNYLHYIKFSLSGTILVGVNVIIYTLGYSLVPKKGSIATMGFITALLNLFLGGSFKIWSILAIFLEAIIIELIIPSFKLKLWSVIIASISANVFSLIYTLFIIRGFLLGNGVIEKFVKLSSKILGNNPNFIYQNLLICAIAILSIHIFNGFLFGIFAWEIKNKAKNIIRRKNSVQEMG